MSKEIDIDVILLAMEAEVHEVNSANGWFDEERSFGDNIALLHSEVSEMLEAFRKWDLQDLTEHPGIGTFKVGPDGMRLPKPEGVGSEAADVLIRLLDMTFRYGIDLGTEYRRKLSYNKTRGYKHGGKAL